MWNKVEEMEAMHVPVMGALEGAPLDRLRKEMLYTYLKDNPDYVQVREYFNRYNSDYATMFEQCMSFYQKLPLTKGGDSHDKRHHGNYNAQGRLRFPGAEHARLAELAYQDEYHPPDRVVHGHDTARRATREEKVQAKSEG